MITIQWIRSNKYYENQLSHPLDSDLCNVGSCRRSRRIWLGELLCRSFISVNIIQLTESCDEPKMIPREMTTGLSRGGEERGKYACTQPLSVWRAP